MKKRTAMVQSIHITAVTFSAIFNIGDSVFARPQSRVIAVQKPKSVFNRSDELFFKDYSLFSKEAKNLSPSKQINKQTYHHEDKIYVNQVVIRGVSESSIVQLGSIEKVNADARIKHFRISRLDTNLREAIKNQQIHVSDEK